MEYKREVIRCGECRQGELSIGLFLCLLHTLRHMFWSTNGTGSSLHFGFHFVKHASTTSANLKEKQRKKKPQKTKQRKKQQLKNHSKTVRLFSPCDEDRSIYSYIYSRGFCTQMRSRSLCFLLPFLLPFPPVPVVCKHTNTCPHYEAHMHTQYITRTQWRVSPVCPGIRARLWPGSGACCGSP